MYVCIYIYTLQDGLWLGAQGLGLLTWCMNRSVRAQAKSQGQANSRAVSTDVVVQQEKKEAEAPTNAQAAAAAATAAAAAYDNNCFCHLYRNLYYITFYYTKLYQIAVTFFNNVYCICFFLHVLN